MILKGLGSFSGFFLAVLVDFLLILMIEILFFLKSLCLFRDILDDFEGIGIIFGILFDSFVDF